jgi:hypothetical protein
MLSAGLYDLQDQWKYSMMDTARTFEPKTILLWRQAADDPDARRILELFPSAQVRLIEQQRMTVLPDISPSKALLAGKRTLMIGRTSSAFAAVLITSLFLYQMAAHTCAHIVIWRLSIATMLRLSKSTSTMTQCSNISESPLWLLVTKSASI